jgi:hypothetical protein
MCSQRIFQKVYFSMLILLLFLLAVSVVSVAGSVKTSLVIVGNCGAGKSFLSNVLAEGIVSVSKQSYKPVTNTGLIFEAAAYNVVDTPGFDTAASTIGVTTSRGDNEYEVVKAVESTLANLRSPSVLICVFGMGGNRVHARDIDTCSMVKSAYAFGDGEVIVMLNQVRGSMATDDDYKANVLSRLQEDGLPWVTPSKLVFFPMLKFSAEGYIDTAEAVGLRKHVMGILDTIQPINHMKKLALETATMKLRRVEAERAAAAKQAEEERIAHERIVSLPKISFFTDFGGADAARARGEVCVHIYEREDKRGMFHDNHLCSPNGLRGWRWSSAGAIAGMDCILFREDATHSWNVNYLCKPRSERFSFHYRWSWNGPVSGMLCTHIYEPSNGWDNNYFCVSLDEPRHRDWLTFFKSCSTRRCLEREM